MGMVRTLGAVTVKAGTPTPVLFAAAGYPSAGIWTATSFSVKNGIATVVLTTALPKTGFNGPNGYPPFQDIYGGVNGGGPPAGGQQVTLWGFTTATYFNGRKVTVIDCNPVTKSFRFYCNNSSGDVSSTSDAGKAAPSPVEHYRAIRLECGLSNGTDYVYVGDLNVSSTQYMAALSLAGQLAIEIAGDNIPVECVMIDGTMDGDTAQVSLIY